MRRIFVLFMFALSVLTAHALDAPDAEAQRQWVRSHPVVRIAVDPQQGTELTGGQSHPLVTRYLDLIAAHTGLRFVTVPTRSWDDSVRAFAEHRVDMLPSTSDRLLHADVGDAALLSHPFYTGRTLIIARTVGPAAVDLHALEGRTVAFKGGGAYEAWLAREHPAITRLPLSGVHEVLAAVESGIADAAVGVDVTYHPIVRRDFALSLRVVGDVPDMPVVVRVAVHPDAAPLLAILDGSLGRITPAENEAVVESWLETAYLRAPTWSQVVTTYRTEMLLGLGLIAALVFALWQMRRAQLASRRGERQKTMLLAVMSHEVRNAVNAVVASIELMGRTSLSDPQRDLMAIAQTSARNLQNLLKSALDYTRTETEGFTADFVSCDAMGVARQVIESHRASIEAKGLSVRLDMPMGPLPWLLLDETRLRQLLDNLLANAIKFTDAGHVGIALWQSEASASDDVRRLVLEVFDTGAGVPADRQGALFRPFAQAHGKRSTRLGGTGLGLAICRDIVHHLGGKLDFTSDVGVGTAVRIELPTSLVPAVPDSTLSDPAAMDSNPFGGTILLVEDHPSNRQIIVAQLKFIGYETVAVDRGQAAIDVFEADRFAAVLLDCELPDMQGYDIAAELRARERAAGGSRTRFIAISANDGEAHVRRCQESGIDTILGKPLALGRLKTALTTAPVELSIDVTFREETWRDLATIRSAIDAGDVTRALHYAHRLRGAALICGAVDIAATADRLESLLRDGELKSAHIMFELDAIAAGLRPIGVHAA